MNLAKLGRNDLYITLFDNCSNDFGQHRLKIDFQDVKFKKYFCLKPQVRHTDLIFGL